MKNIFRILHRWLGLLSGAIVFVIAITGCIYAFQVELQDLTQSFRFVTPEEKAYLPPSRLKAIAEAALPEKHVHSVLYADSSRAAQVLFYNYEPRYYYSVYINQYTGEVLKVHDIDNSFFGQVLRGHFYLWLPDAIGQPVVATATLIFVVILISGLYLWWPRTEKGTRQRFTIKWNARWRRRNYDLHNVLGFYVSWIAVIMALTGLVWGFQWFAQGVYGLASGGKELKPYQEPLSDTTQRNAYPAGLPVIDQLWNQMVAEHPRAATVEIHIPANANTSILAAINADAGTYWRLDYRYFDQYSLEELPVDHQWNRIHQASAADKLMRMNYDIHTGAIFGLAGKILAFFASLLCASLPVTGTIIWLGRRNKRKQSLPKQQKLRKKVLAEA